MVEGMKDLLINVLFMYSTLFIFKTFWLDKRRARKEIAITILLSLNVILCMIFTIHVHSGFAIDLREVPFIISLYFDDWILQLVLFLVSALFRYSIGGQGIMEWLAIDTGLLILFWFIRPLFQRLSSKKKIVVSVLLAFALSMGGAVLTIIWFRSTISLISVDLECMFVLIQTLGTWILMSMIEMMYSEYSIREEIRNTEQLKVVSQIAASVSHEVRNPLTVTKGFIQLLRNPELSDEKRSNFIHLALKELDRAQSIITDYLSFAKPQSEHVELLHLAEELKYVIDVMSPYALMNDVDIQSELIENSPVIGDRLKFRQCLINLMKNSVEAMKGGGTLSVELVPLIEQVRINVIDNGIGMSREQIEQLGKPYVTSKEGGTGLGTMVIFSIIESMGGVIEVKSEPNQGTQFSIFLPLAQGQNT